MLNWPWMGTVMCEYVGITEDIFTAGYAVEAEAPGWNAPRTVALTLSVAVGYAAFHAAARERPDANIVLRCGDMILSHRRPVVA